MRTAASILLTLICFSGVVGTAVGQGIINGGFEHYDPATWFLQGWKVKDLRGRETIDRSTIQNGVVGSLIPFRLTGTELPGPSINRSEGTGEPPNLREGEYYLWANGFGGGTTVVMVQEVMVPEDAYSLQFRGYNGSPYPCQIDIDSNRVVQQFKTILGPGAGDWVATVWWADVSSYRGQKVNLSFSFLFDCAIDEIRFSSEPVPEPGTWSMIMIGIGICLLNYSRVKNGGQTAS